MTRIMSFHPTENKKSFTAQKAEIISFNREEKTAKIHIDILPEIQKTDAALALPYDIDLTCGDKVLIAGEDICNIYIIGVLSAKVSATIRADNGAYARLDTDRASLHIFSPHDELIIEYDTVKDTTKVSSSTGKMVFNSPESITFKSKSIDFTGKDKINMKVQGHDSNSLSTFSLGNYQTKLNCPDLRIITKKGDLFIDELRITGKKMLTNVVQATFNMGKLETKTKTLIHKARNMYQSVENLSQLKSGRLKTLIKSTYHLKSKNTVLKAEEDFKVKAEEINLG